MGTAFPRIPPRNDHWWLVIYQDGLPVRRQSPIQVVTGPSVEQLLLKINDKGPKPLTCHNKNIKSKINVYSWSTLLIETNALPLVQTVTFKYGMCAPPYTSEICRCPELTRLRTNWLVEWLINNEWLTVGSAVLWNFIAAISAIIVAVTQPVFLDTLIAASRTRNTTMIAMISYRTQCNA